MTAWSRIVAAGPAVLVLVVTSAALVVLPIVRRLVPRGRRHRGGVARGLLGVAFLLAATAIAIGTMGAASPGNMLQLASFLALLLGAVVLGGLVLFDVVLPRLRIDVPSIVRDLLLVAVAVAIGVGFLRLAGLDVFSLVTTSAVLTAVVGLALQTTIANVASGLGLQVDRTLRRGEWIEVGDQVGKILEIGWRATRIHAKNGDTIFVPNGELVTKEVRSFGRWARAHRLTIRIGFHYRHPPRDVCAALLSAVGEAPDVLAQPAPDCWPVEFGDSAVVYEVRYWIGDFARDHEIDGEVRARLWYAARGAGLEIPFPIRTLVFPGDAARPALDSPALAG